MTTTRLYEGAEAYLYPASIMDKRLLVKHRISKSYRHPHLDRRLRESRTVTEARLVLAALEAGVRVPAVFLVDTEDTVAVVERIEGQLLRDIIEREGATEHVIKLVEEVGYMAGILHENDIVHGDLTTSNVVVTTDDKPFIIDFGLASHSSEEEDKAVDVHLFLRSLESTHPEHVDKLYEAFLRGYARARGPDRALKVKRLVEKIRLMGRYVEARRRSVWSQQE